MRRSLPGIWGLAALAPLSAVLSVGLTRLLGWAAAPLPPEPPSAVAPSVAAEAVVSRPAEAPAAKLSPPALVSAVAGVERARRPQRHESPRRPEDVRAERDPEARLRVAGLIPRPIRNRGDLDRCVDAAIAREIEIQGLIHAEESEALLLESGGSLVVFDGAALGSCYTRWFPGGQTLRLTLTDRGVQYWNLHAPGAQQGRALVNVYVNESLAWATIRTLAGAEIELKLSVGGAVVGGPGWDRLDDPALMARWLRALAAEARAPLRPQGLTLAECLGR